MIHTADFDTRTFTFTSWPPSRAQGGSYPPTGKFIIVKINKFSSLLPHLDCEGPFTVDSGSFPISSSLPKRHKSVIYLLLTNPLLWWHKVACIGVFTFTYVFYMIRTSSDHLSTANTSAGNSHCLSSKFTSGPCDLGSCLGPSFCQSSALHRGSSVCFHRLRGDDLTTGDWQADTAHTSFPSAFLPSQPTPSCSCHLSQFYPCTGGQSLLSHQPAPFHSRNTFLVRDVSCR